MSTASLHRCALHAGTQEAADLAVELCRRAAAAGSPVVAHVDDVVRRALTDGATCPTHTVPDDRRLLLVPWPAGKVSPAVSPAVRPARDGCRIVVRADHPDGG